MIQVCDMYQSFGFMAMLISLMTGCCERKTLLCLEPTGQKGEPGKHGDPQSDSWKHFGAICRILNNDIDPVNLPSARPHEDHSHFCHWMGSSQACFSVWVCSLQAKSYNAQCHINPRAHGFQIPHQPDLQDPWNGCQLCLDNVATLWNCLPSVSPRTISSDSMLGSSRSKTILWCCNCVRIIINKRRATVCSQES